MSAPASASPQLLVVEDDSALQQLLQEGLAEMGYPSRVASSLEQALFLVHQQPFDLIVTDTFSRTGQDVLAPLRELLELSHPTPVLVCTGWSFDDRAVRQAGFAGLVRKPIHLDHLVTTIAECLDQPSSPAQLRQAEGGQRFFASFIHRDAEA